MEQTNELKAKIIKEVSDEYNRSISQIENRIKEIEKKYEGNSAEILQKLTNLTGELNGIKKMVLFIKNVISD